MARILQACNSAFYLTHFLVPLVRGLVAAGHEVECACEGDDVPRETFGGLVPIHAFPFERSASPLGFLRAIARMRRLIRRGRYDCVDSHNRSASIVARVAAHLERVPVNVYTAHGFYFHDGQGRVAYEATVGLEAALARLTDFTLSQSADDVAMMTRRGLIDRRKIETIGNGIDTRRFSPRAEERPRLERDLDLREGRFRIAATGRLVRGKGFTDLLEAFARLAATRPELELLLIGGVNRYDIEPYQAEFFARVKDLGVESRVTITGMVERVEDYLAVSDAFVLPSYREGMPRALLEAMSMGLPSIATDIRGCREIISHGVSGWLFPPHDVARLAALLSELRATPDAGASVGRRGRELVCGSFDEQDYVARQVRTIGRLLADAPRSKGRSRPRGASFEATP